jgi:hypothetical protein
MNAHRPSRLNESDVQDNATAVPNNIDGERNRAATYKTAPFIFWIMKSRCAFQGARAPGVPSTPDSTSRAGRCASLSLRPGMRCQGWSSGSVLCLLARLSGAEHPFHRVTGTVCAGRAISVDATIKKAREQVGGPWPAGRARHRWKMAQRGRRVPAQPP